MARRLSGYVIVTDDVGRPRSFGPNDDVPAWAAKQITNPKAWADGESGDAAPAADAQPSTESRSTPPPAPPGDGPPPQVGAGSSTKAWIAYARSKGFEVADDVRKKDVIAGLADAGIPVVTSGS